MKQLLSPRDLAKAVGASESSVKRWVDDGVIAAARTAGGHRRIPAREAVRFIRNSKAVLLEPRVVDLPELESLDRTKIEPGRETERLFDLLRNGDSDQAAGLVLSLYLDGWSAAQVLDGPMGGAMERMGQLWNHKPSDIYLEHRATQIAIETLARLRTVLPPPNGSHVAIGGAPPEDPYVLPTLAAAVVLHGQGVRAINLGPNTPFDSLELAISETGSSLAWLSVTGVADPAGASRDIDRLVARLSRKGIPLIVGGREASRLTLAQSDYLYRGCSMAELEALSRGLLLAGPTRRGDQDSRSTAEAKRPLTD